MSGIFTKRGAEAVESATAEKDAKSSAIVSFKSGTTLKVRVKGPADSAEYYAYGIFNRVNTFVPAQPATRNAKGFITANPTVWDRAADYLYAQAKAAKDAGDAAAAEELSKEAYLYKGKPRYLIGFGSLETGEDIVVDLSAKQARGVLDTIKKYAKKLDKVAFELSKSGTSTSTAVTLTPILDMDEDLTEAERANFVKCGEKPFDFALFDDCLYIADEQEQIKNLVVAGFDVAKIGLTLGAGASTDEAESDDSLPQF
ncbi:hypothetical protein A6764_15225 [Brevibacillus sp. WF146]|uniref:hypothetical protein n=1 Tax=Brevibacillus sp. WF146 TaxID=319501 RepID=UPI0007ED8BDF|nr:hypothetical protein [Brevibacillus sp. WF146]UYZ12175.1 hypothetical protein A6764_15225 [Brevibacillus sp. WF146]